MEIINEECEETLLCECENCIEYWLKHVKKVSKKNNKSLEDNGFCFEVGV